VTDPLNNATQLAYDFGDPFSTTDPLGNTATRFTDNAGRVLSVTDPLGNLSISDYDTLNRVTKNTDQLTVRVIGGTRVIGVSDWGQDRKRGRESFLDEGTESPISRQVK
jgi:YD repeat-containing protein